MFTFIERLSQIFEVREDCIRIPQNIECLDNFIFHYSGSRDSGILYVGQNKNGVFFAESSIPILRRTIDDEDIILVCYSCRVRFLPLAL